MVGAPAIAFRGLAPKPPQSLPSLRGLGRLPVPQESSTCTPTNWQEGTNVKIASQINLTVLLFSQRVVCYREGEIPLRSLAGFVRVEKAMLNKVECDFHKLIHTGNHRNPMELSIGLFF